MYTVLYPTVSLDSGGAEGQLLELVRGLDKGRFRPIVAPLYPVGALEKQFQAVPGLEVICLDRRHKYDPSVIWKLVSLLRRRRVDIVQPFVSPASFFGLLAGTMARTPVKIATERGGAKRLHPPGARLYQFAEHLLLPFVDLAVANSEGGREHLQRSGAPNSKIRVIANGVNLGRLRPSVENIAAHRRRLGAGDGTPVIGILAGLKHIKGQDAFLRAAAEVAMERPEARFAIVGEGPMRQELESLARQLRISERVVFFGHQDRVADFLALFDMLVSASRGSEGHSNSILEAMALGVPVIATDIGGNRELVRHGETGLLVEADNHSALATAILELLRRPDLARDCAAGAHAMIAERFTLEGMVSSYEALYEQALHRWMPSASRRLVRSDRPI
jgi:glycosyltransferase involved in cell wall biosynthesis